ncbi:uncharacterized protein K452DRAFT_339426 [Aplosporella prunicola CBS 121167]|uniref:Uncharacterized protein n=1 Tax=Aplosporella prunicola CBS 121167 TaxID=1176127 RepID=A0A6A6B2Z3_9PEZI|nr:uncharacterized protein K452DRAFT_339426 [Aplosporella prunicola CBS 121167]KAF2138186.1 hypothetical protein K452DRAFT_339426 [Aplosporella prunicola CBS 121167]
MTGGRCHPPPEIPGPYFDFGFCTCQDEFEEMRLSNLYKRLLFGSKPLEDMAGSLSHLVHPPLCTFTEFWHAFDERRLSWLIDSRGLKQEREKFRHLDTVLGYRAGQAWPIVWLLKTFLNDESATAAPTLVAIDFAFLRCKNYFEIRGLKDLYREVLRYADLLELNKACVTEENRLLDFVSEYVKVKKEIVEVLQPW